MLIKSPNRGIAKVVTYHFENNEISERNFFQDDISERCVTLDQCPVLNQIFLKAGLAGLENHQKCGDGTESRFWLQFMAKLFYWRGLRLRV